MKPSVTVILPAHNAQDWIGAAIGSVLRQTYQDWVLWVLENGSTDATLEVARKFEGPRVKVFELGPVGFQGAIQHAIDHAETDWLARMDADDLMLPERLQVQMKFLGNHPEALFVGTSFAVLTPFGHVFENLPPIATREVDRLFLGLGQGRFGDPCTVFNRRAAQEVGGMDSEFNIGDVPLLFRLLRRGKGWQIGQPLHVYRLVHQSMSQNLGRIQDSMRARQKYVPEVLSAFPTQIHKSSFWEKIALLELIAGDSRALRSAISELEREGGGAFQEHAQHLRTVSRGRKIAAVGYRWKYRKRYRRRPDWERYVAALTKQCSLVEKPTPGATGSLLLSAH